VRFGLKLGRVVKEQSGRGAIRSLEPSKVRGQFQQKVWVKLVGSRQGEGVAEEGSRKGAKKLAEKGGTSGGAMSSEECWNTNKH
jgi:hypothetical protein